MRDVICEILEIGQKSYYVWKNKSHRKIVKLLEVCFTKQELQYYLQTDELPAKFKLANKYYSNMWHDFSEFMVDTNNKIFFTILFTYGSIENMGDKCLELYEKGIINKKELLEHFQYNKSNLNFALALYIEENIIVNWNIYNEEIKSRSTSNWLIQYFEIIKLSIEKNCYDKTFGNPDIEEFCYVPQHPELFSCYQGWEEVEKKYINVLLEVKNAFLTNTLNDLPLWSIYDSSFN